LLLERTDGVGARWRSRYEGLHLNTMRQLSTLPGYRMPRRYGRYPRREDFIAYLEDYAARLGLAPRFQTELKRVDRAGEDGLWKLETSNGPLLARYVVVATGYDAIPRLPEWAQGNGFRGELIHAAEYHSPSPYEGRQVLIVGAGNTGIDIAGFLIEAGAGVSVSMRRPPTSTRATGSASRSSSPPCRSNGCRRGSATWSGSRPSGSSSATSPSTGCRGPGTASRPGSGAN
jgi:cation diffusion facilitator CzcD-associated flavoprotein CzcO